jgi:hypothetical protein
VNNGRQAIAVVVGLGVGEKFVACVAQHQTESKPMQRMQRTWGQGGHDGHDGQQDLAMYPLA